MALTCLVASVTRADDLQRLIPWSSLQGKPHPDEAELARASWTTLSRESLAPRVEQTINHDWTFNYFPAEQLDTSLITASAADARWPVVALPHTWHTFETTREIHPFIARPSERDSKYWWYGWGVYRKTFVLDPKTIDGRRVFAEFDGVMKYCRIFLNGKELGDHKGGYGSFDFDLTSQLRSGTNVLAVAVNARRDDVFRIPPMTAGNFDVYGGIYRDVRIVVKSAVHIPFQGSAEHEGGTFVTTPQVSADHATVRVRTWVKNNDSQPRTVTLRTRLLDPAGKELATAETNATVAVGEIHEFDQPLFNVAKPQLWSIETPALYSVTSEVRVGKTLSDRYASPLGFRWFEWNKTENRGYLNGKQLHLHGSNRHQEFPWLGDAVPKWIHVRDMAEMRFGQNHNFLRTAHYTQDSLVYDLADRYGMLICEEVPNIKDIDFDEDVQRQQVIEMVRRDRNHPSIVMWSMGNETSDPADSAWAHAEDDTRLIHLRRSNSIEGGKFVTSTHQQIDMENLLRCTVRGWTDRDVMDLQPVNGQQAGTEEWQHTQAMVEGGSQRGRIDMPNGNMWIYADHGADREYLNSPLKHINPKGWVDLYRIPKYMYFLWQANYLETPMAFIHPHFWQTHDVGQKKDIIVDSNCDRVELFVNGRSIGTQQPNAKSFWNVTFTNVLIERGKLKAVARKGGATVTSRVVMAGAPARLTLAASQSAIAASRDSVAVLTVDVVDENGVPVPEFSRDLHWQVSGPAKLISPELYQSDIKRKEEMNGEFYIVTPVSAVLRATGRPGTITVTVKADGVAPAAFKIAAQEVRRNSDVVTEPALSDVNRHPVATAPAESARTETTPNNTVIKPVHDDIVLPRDKDRAFYKSAVLKWFAQNDPAPMKRWAFDELLMGLTEHLLSNGGLLVADDFNHRAQQFNDVGVLNDAILAQRLPKSYAVALVRNYARRTFRDGELLRVSEELQWIKSLPKTAKTETVKNKVTASELFQLWYPEAAKLSAGQQQAALDRFQKINQAAGTPLFNEKLKQGITYSPGSPLLRLSLEQLLTVPTAK